MTREMDLGGVWEVRPVSRFDGDYDRVGGFKEAEVPGHWQTTPGLEDYAGKAVYKKSFKFMPEPDKRFFLRFNGVFYWSTSYLNGARLGANEGYFFPFEHEITGLARKENELLVEVDSPDEDDKSCKRQLTGVFHHWDCLDPATNPGGIWLPVEIHSSGPARISDPLFTTAYLGKDNGYARVTGRVSIDTPDKADLVVRISFIPKTFEGEAKVFEREVWKRAGTNTYHYHLDLKDPVLWWTHDRGRPDLYTLRVEVIDRAADKVSDIWEQPFGVRTIEMRDYIAYLNGERLYLRGNNYPPGDARIASMTRERCGEDIRLARECNMNILRVHAHVDHPVFYDVCDEQGMLLWQDFPMQWYYRPEAEDQALRQAERMVFHLGGRPSVAMWCMHNEPIRVIDTKRFFGPVTILRTIFSAFIWNPNRDRLDHEMARRVRYLDPSRFATYCSGERGLFREPGDAHLYYGWYFGPLHWFHRVYKKKPETLRFITEFGSQSLPNLENAVKFMDPDIGKVDWKRLEDRHHLQRRFMFRMAGLHPKKHKSLAEYIQATQDYQSELNRYHIDRVRALKYKPGGGVVPFLLLDSNPSIQWSVIDYWREPKSSYHAMKKALSPVYAFTILAKPRYKKGAVASIPLYAVNDTAREVEARVTLTVVSPVGEKIVEEDRTETLPADCEAMILANPEIKLRWEGDYKIAVKIGHGGKTLENDYVLKAR